MTSLRISLIAATLIVASTAFALASVPADGPNHGAPLPVIGAGLPLLAAGGALYALRKRFRKGG